MARVRTVEFLPEIFQTPVNRQFLNATLDQLVQEPNFKKTQGYVGRKVGPGVNPTDRYVVEPTKSRTDYQLEPGVVSLNKNNSRDILNAITYPGITDALKLQGAVTDDPQSLYTSEYYTWDPFVDFDKLVNFSQYYWLPAGPLAVDVSATDVPLTDTFTVTRENGVYTFSGVAGDNPELTLVRGGNYNFDVAQNAKDTVTFRVTNKANSAYVINYQDNPNLTLVRGNTYVFNFTLTGEHPFFIKTISSLGNINTYDSGVTNNGTSIGTLTFVVPQDAPDTLYYNSALDFNMKGTFTIVDGIPGTGPGFWIQTEPGVNGRIPATPNISSRLAEVNGVINNGEDLGTVEFDVPYSTAQNFYYSMPVLAWPVTGTQGRVDLVTGLQFTQINNQYVTVYDPTTGDLVPGPFFQQNPDGIDGITNLSGRTVVFTNPIEDPQDGGWQITTPFDPLATDPTDPNPPAVGAFDTQLFDQTTDIVSKDIKYSVWQINYVLDSNGETYMSLTSVKTVDNLTKFRIQFGTEYASTNWYKNASGFFQEMPLLSAVNEYLYYQDGEDPFIFGRIRLIDQTNADLYISEILGKKQYTSPNGVVFTNGMKVTFRGTTVPSSYENNSYYVEGVGTAITLSAVSDFITPETYTQSATIPFDSTSFDTGNFDGTLNAPLYPDYLTINRASIDLNPWTRSNRWFHISVIEASATYNNTVPIIDNLQRGQRPILEFRAGTRLFDFGTQGKQPVNIIDFQETDALSNINGTTGYSIDGYTLINGSRIIFAADTDPQVRNKIYEVELISPDTVPPLIAEPIINLVPAADATVVFDQTVVCLSGITQQGLSYWFDGVNWISSQQKTKTNQAPLFNLYDADGYSFADTAKYFSSTFVGSKLFSYAVGDSSIADSVLGFPLRYLSLSNVGDIVFDNNLYTDTFVYVANSVGTTVSTGSGFARQYNNRLDYVKELGWQTAATKSLQRQQFQFTYDGSPLQLDVAVNANNVVPSVQLYVGSIFVEPSGYTVTTTAYTTTITLLDVYTLGSVIEIAVLSDQVSKTAFYEVPINLENNPLNTNSPYFTLGTVRNHYGTICQNLLNLVGPINGNNNSRDLGDIIPYGTQILQQSSPLTLAGYFMRSKEYNVFASLAYNSREYIKFKSQLMETVINNDYIDMTISQILDAAIAEITLGRTNLNPFYWSDMLPTGKVYNETNTTVSQITTATFNTTQTYDFKSANYLGLLVYLTRTVDGQPVTTLLERTFEYEVSADSPTLTITIPLSVGDVVSVREYNTTVGNYVPNTPSKMGLYPKFRPQIFVDTTFINPVPVIQGHDGSITVAFDDLRTEVLLEFEKRIYNNIKTDDNPIPLTADDVIPGFFRTTDYTQSEINSILSQDFLSWVGWNKLDYKAQDYIAGNPFTYNYSSAGNKINEAPLLGAWRGIYRYFYDTTTPSTTPWEMLGLSEEPDWWQDRYGPAPYTSDNLVLWDDLAAGLVADPIAPYVKPNFRRPATTTSLGQVQLFPVIPTGSEGLLLSPLDSVVGQYDPTAFVKSWAVGDGGPVEASWWESSSYPFAVMRLLALTRPAEFFSLFADRDLYKYNDSIGQYLYNGRYRLDANGVEVYGNGTSKASYINWIVDYNQQLGINTTTALTDALQNLDVRLCYRMASFTDKQYLQVFVERSSPNSLNSSLQIPDDSYQILLYKNEPFSEIFYSALIVERVANGYAVYGYNTTQPYFNIIASSANGRLQTIEAGGTAVRVPEQYTQNIVQVPYGYVFTNTTVVVDFILSYGQYLENQGLVFDDRENGYDLNWKQMAAEFLYFSQQGWSAGTLINLNPIATKLRAVKAGAIIDTIESTTPENMLLDQNRVVLPTRDLIVDRNGNEFTITSTTGQTISFLHLKFTNYEDMVVLDNTSVFNDLVYDPATAARQNRIRITAFTAADWTGQLDAQGFILNQPNVKEWAANKKYTKGEIVIYKNQYYSAAAIVQPKVKFDFNDWNVSDYQLIQEGLLPNIANKANQLANSYNVNSANLERDNDLFAYGLIGFRPRQYMADLNLDDVSQVNLYQQFLGTKGTTRAAEIFTRADLGKETGTYDIFENWGVLISTYGANANKSFFELRLNEALLQPNPSTVQVVLPGEQSSANQTILLSDVWRESYKLTSPDILPTAYNTNSLDSLPSAGYVNIDDVDITVFSLDDPASIAAQLDIVGIGTTIWVAKSNSYDWNIYRCEGVPGRLTAISDNLDGTSIAQFSTGHNLSTGDLIIVRYFDQTVDGVYRVLSVPSLTTVTIAYSFGNTNQTTITGTGLAFFLQTMRVSQASDVINLPYGNLLIPSARVWVDNNGAGQWEVLEKQEPFTEFAELTPYSLTTNSEFGSAISQTKDHNLAMVGAPGANIAYTYKKAENEVYTFNIGIVLNAANVAGFGRSLQFGNQNWSVIGAPDSNSGQGYAATYYVVPGTTSFRQTQLLVAPDQEFNSVGFGSAVAISTDERWMYISSPGGNRVYAYGRVDVEEQTVSYLTDSVTYIFNYSQAIQIDSTYPDQLIVTLNGVVKEYGTDYTINSNAVVFTYTPNENQTLVISRRQAVALDQSSYFGVQQTSTSGSGSGAAFTVDVKRGVYNVTITSPGTSYAIGNTLTILGTQIGEATPAGDLVITVTSVTSGGITGFTYTGNGVENTDTFMLDPYLYTATNIYAFTVFVDGQVQRPHIDYEFNNDSTESTQDLTFTAGHVPAAGATIAVTAGSYWQYIDILSVAGLSSIAEFGASLSTTTDGRQVMIGAPRDQAESITYGGAAYVFDRNVIQYRISNASQLVYTITGNFVEPIAVLLNGQYLTNTDQYIDGQYTISGNTVVLSNELTLTIGDSLEIETNEFHLLDKLTVPTPVDETRFGDSIVVCPRNCSIYTGAPFASDSQNGMPETGSVQRNVNQSRVYGVTTSTIANPTLTAGDTLRINNMEVAVPANNTIAGLVSAINTVQTVGLTTTSSTITGTGTTATITFAVQPTVPFVAGQPITVSGITTDGLTGFNGTYVVLTSSTSSVSYYNPTVTTTVIVTGTISTPLIPNVVATSTPDLTFVGNGSNKVFNIGSLYSAADSYTTVVYLDGVLQTGGGVNYTYNNTTQNINFVVAPAQGKVILVVSGRITISVKNIAAADPKNKISVLPGTIGSAFDNIGFNTYAYTQTIVSPRPSAYAYFGQSVDIDSSAVNLVVGAPNGNIYEPEIFDGGETYFDDRSTTFYSPILNSGVVFTYDYLPSANASVNNPGNFVFGEQIFADSTTTNEHFGFAVNYTSGRLLVGAPNSFLGLSTGPYGKVATFDNVSNKPAWAVIHKEQPTVDIARINGAFSYDRLLSGYQQYYDWFNPLQGKILGAARRNIDYIGAIDPASYNQGIVHNNGNSWAAEHLGEMWWDTDTVRFIDPNQDDITYASRRWGQTFPGSRVDIYQWVYSTVPPSEYVGSGTPFSTTSYTQLGVLTKDNIIETRYYFWVRGINTVDTAAGKTLSALGVSSYISSPRTSGIPYIAPLNASTVALYNVTGLISAQDTILHIAFDRQLTDAAIHTEYALIADGRPDSFLNETLYRKLQDSFCGTDTSGANVPDPLLSPAERYGVQFRPRQSMFANRFMALQNYLTRANTVLAQFPITESRSFTLLNSAEPIPQSAVDGTVIWNMQVPNLEVLGYQNLYEVPLGYLYLVDSDSNQNGLWTIYVVAEGAELGSRTLNLIRVQNYDTRRYWQHIDWYEPGYNSSVNPLVSVPNRTALDTVSLLDVPVGGSAQVQSNGQGKFEIYLRTSAVPSTGWTRVGLQDGTIEFKEELWNYALGNFGFDSEVFDSQYFDQEPVIETRKIIQAINEQLFIDELLIERNQSLILMFNFIYSEFTSPDWLIKTSLIDVNHKIRALLPYQIYLQDNQTFVLDYINEVKPYHVQLREFNLTYTGEDIYPGAMTDFDVPAYYNTVLPVPQYVSPVLLPYTQSSSTIQSNNSDAASNAEIWTIEPWKDWYNNYLLSIQSISIVNGGSGYTTVPTIQLTGDYVVAPDLQAVINSAGQVVAVNIITPGSGFSTTPIITFVGGNGSGAQAVVYMGNDLVRSIKTTIKYDRCEYTSTVQLWTATGVYNEGELVRYAGTVWSANANNTTGAPFNPADWTVVDAESLNGADRTFGYYQPTADEPGLSLPLLIDGISYPGVQVTGPGYNQNTGFDVGNFDINPFDNISYGPEGRPTYDPAILDAEYSSSYLDIYLGTRPTSINVDGGAYVGPFESHAPEELVPGIEFDTLDMRVYTTPGADWERDGHGFPSQLQKYTYNPVEPTLSFGTNINTFPNPMAIIVSNQTFQTDLAEGINYTVDWVNQTVTIISGVNAGNIVVVAAYQVGGGNQLFKSTYNGADVGDTVTVPVSYYYPITSTTPQIQDIAIFVNGVYLPETANDSTANYTYAASGNYATEINFTTTYTDADELQITVIGATTVDSTTVNYDWSAPQTQQIIGDGSTLAFDLNNAMIYTNPDNVIVTVNGKRARTSAGAEYYGDGSSEFLLPQRLGFSQSLIADNQVRVYLNDIPQTLGTDFFVEPYDPADSGRSVIFATQPSLGERILICVTTNTQCYVNNTGSGYQLVFEPSQGIFPNLDDVILVTSWNDTRQQNILTQVFVGPVTTGITESQGYDTTDFDQGTVSNEPGSFDYSTGSTVQTNSLFLERPVTDPSRLWVSVNGWRQFAYDGFVLNGQEVVLASGLLGSTDVVMITEMTNSVIPEAMAFRIFQDMRGVQATYRITPSTTTTLAQDLGQYDDIVYVTDVNALGAPDVAINVWGVLTVNGERIMYREIDYTANTVSSLLRGTAGTGAADHTAGSTVYDMGRGNLLPLEFQNYIVETTTLADGSTTLFVADNIDVDLLDSTTLEEAVEVYVGGTLLQPMVGYSITLDNPVNVLFDTAPAAGVNVTILVRRGVTWYQQGVNTASDGVALQDTNTQAARFLRGL